MTPAAQQSAGATLAGARGALAPVYAAHNASGNLTNLFKFRRRSPPCAAPLGAGSCNGPAPFFHFDHLAHGFFTSNIPWSDNGGIGMEAFACVQKSFANRQKEKTR